MHAPALSTGATIRTRYRAPPPARGCIQRERIGSRPCGETRVNGPSPRNPDRATHPPRPGRTGENGDSDGKRPVHGRYLRAAVALTQYEATYLHEIAEGFTARRPDPPLLAHSARARATIRKWRRHAGSCTADAIAPSMPAVVVFFPGERFAQLTNQGHDEAMTKESEFQETGSSEAGLRPSPDETPVFPQSGRSNGKLEELGMPFPGS